MRPLLAILVVVLGMYFLKTMVLDKKSEESAPVARAAVSDSASPPVKKGLPVDVFIAKKVNKSNLVFATGTIVPNEEVALKSEVAGRVVELNIAEGGFVKKGQLIAKLNDDDLTAQLKKLEYEEQLAEQIRARQQKLLDIDAISKEEYDLAVNKVNTLSADKELLQVQLKKTEVRAPFSGVMGLKQISQGAYITPGTVIANIVQINPVKLDFSVPEKYSNKIKRGQKITFTIDGDEEDINARIIAIDPVIDEDLRTLRVRAQSNNSNGRLLPGMFIRAKVPLGEESSIMIPTEAIIPILKGKKVFLMKNGRAVEAEVQTGLRTDTDIQVEKGISVGDSIIVSALMSVKAGTGVRLRTVRE